MRLVSLKLIFLMLLAGWSQLVVCAAKENKDDAKDEFASNKALLTLLDQSRSFYILENHQKADSVFKKAIQLAESTRNKDVILKTFFYNTSFEISENTTLLKKEQFIEYVLQGINYAKMYNRPAYVAYGNASISEVYRKKGDLTAALKYANLAFSTSLNLEDDSCKVIACIQLGRIYQAQKEMLLAFKTFTNAHDIATKCGNTNLLTMVYHALASLYGDIDKDQVAKDYYFKSLDLNTKNDNKNGIIADYIAIGASYEYDNAITYLKKALQLAKTEKNLSLEKKAQIYIFSYLIINGDRKKSMKYLDDNPIIKTYYQNRGPFNYNWTLGEIYLYANELDSAKKYFDEAENQYLINNEYDNSSKLNFLGEYSMLYKKLNDKAKTFDLYKKAFDISVTTNNFSQKIDYSNKIKEMYTEQGDYKSALFYSNLLEHYKDTLDVIMKEKEFASLEIENENKRIEAEKAAAEIAQKRINNLQYMGITVLTCLIFTVLLFISGKSKYSVRLVEIIGFFAFIFLFEFIILVLDTKIHHATHGSPLLIWLIKIVIISFLLPLHHYTESVVVDYLKSKKMLKDKEKLSIQYLLNIFSLNLGHKPHTTTESDEQPTDKS